MEYTGASDWWACLEADLPTSSYDAIDYNVCGFSAGVWANWVGDLSNWQALGWGAHSQAANPGFISAWDLSPASNTAAIVDAGHPTLSSPTDIDGNPRDSAPDAGAYEWSAAGGAIYYVAANEPGASDSNNGLYPTHQGGQDGPWLTIQQAADTMTA